MTQAFVEDRVADYFQSIPLSSQTVQRKVTDRGEQVTKTMPSMAQNSCCFSLCLDELKIKQI